MNSQNNEQNNQNQNGDRFGFFFPLNFQSINNNNNNNQTSTLPQPSPVENNNNNNNNNSQSNGTQGFQEQIPQVHFFIYPMTEGNGQTNPGVFFFSPFFMPQQEVYKPRASESAIKNLPIVTITKEHVDAQLSCPICLENFSLPVERAETKEKTTARQMPCNHMFCESCLFQWLRQNNSCPLCRNEIEAEIVETQQQQQNNNNNSNDSNNNNGSANVHLNIPLFGVINIPSTASTPTPSSPSTTSNATNATTTTSHNAHSSSCALANVGCCEEADNDAVDASSSSSVIVTLPQCHHRFHASCLRTSLLVEGYSLGDFNSTSRPLNFRCPTCRAPAIVQSDVLKTPGTSHDERQQELPFNLPLTIPDPDDMDLD